MAKSRRKSKITPAPEPPKDRFEGEFGEQGDPMSPMTAWMGANPGVDSGDIAYRINCQRNPFVYMLRRAGYNVEAMPNYKGDKLSRGLDKKEGWQSIFKDPDTAVQDVQGRTYKDEIKNIRAQMAEWGDGAIAIIAVGWKGGGGHAFVAEQINGETVFMDTQIARRDASLHPDSVYQPGAPESRAKTIAKNGSVSYAGADVNIEKRMARTIREYKDPFWGTPIARATRLARLDNAEFNMDQLKKCATIKRPEK